MGDDRPFVCNAPGCGQRFTNEDHLAVHKHKHEMTLKFGPARTDSVIIADQTPTPTRFLKNCEEVGLFNELASSFEHEFKKATEDDEKKSAGALDMSLPSTPDIKIKEEEPVEVDSSPPDSPASNPQSPQNKEKEITSKPVIISTPTPTIVRPGSLPLHLGYDPLHPTLPSPTSVITQAPPSNRQLGSPTGSLPLVVQLANGQTMPVLPGPPVQMPSVISLARPMSMVPNIPGIPGPPINSSGSISPSGLPVHSEAKMRLKASLTASSSLNGSNLVVGSASTMVTARPEQSQILVQHPDAPSPAQPQVSPAQPTPSTGGRRRRTVDEDPDERRQRFLERNRAAASRCRQKRKLWVSSLEKKAEELTTQNIQLSNEVTLLRNEVAQLKQLLLAHKDCPVTALQKKTQGYLAESPKESSEPTGSPAPVIQHSSVTASPNGLSVRSAAEAVATSVLTQMASQRTELSMPIPSHVIMAPQSQSAGR
ncbi:cyclic AMP-dependent transcription factor ATF-7 isoform X1 [Falco naumanni]|nr:cyclic AMP-dependent transcription factor ATF-7 isoform X1 [Falco peregrinus]XP_027656729.1 cyclic AMP-dependent transcription factor ATF-7 isoform X1 [Falco cherrug]XP_037267955.1 cyclic AMP-dependent transcription factor ATF-7 isoform X1 [Falco rusticolus]XP_037267956.1 cyclic AMP-dependent transcription factor ATF-7 isoform X1 [Falco rusticolus]XP_037267957.1 cyclic AMP-dependent transcription factor ATF-7 isoform X1 [Falco rusticolus]XP_037267958.1 cyclic AMP-dependent transcription fac